MSEQENAQPEQVNVETVKVEMEVGKESKDVADALHDLIEDIKAGKDVGAIATENLPGIMSAVNGYDKLDDEMKHKSRNATVAYSGYKLAEALVPAK